MNKQHSIRTEDCSASVELHSKSSKSSYTGDDTTLRLRNKNTAEGCRAIKTVNTIGIAVIVKQDAGQVDRQIGETNTYASIASEGRHPVVLAMTKVMVIAGLERDIARLTLNVIEASKSESRV